MTLSSVFRGVGVGICGVGISTIWSSICPSICPSIWTRVHSGVIVCKSTQFYRILKWRPKVSTFLCKTLGNTLSPCCLRAPRSQLPTSGSGSGKCSGSGSALLCHKFDLKISSGGHIRTFLLAETENIDRPAEYWKWFQELFTVYSSHQPLWWSCLASYSFVSCSQYQKAGRKISSLYKISSAAMILVNYGNKSLFCIPCIWLDI